MRKTHLTHDDFPIWTRLEYGYEEVDGTWVPMHEGTVVEIRSDGARVIKYVDLVDTLLYPTADLNTCDDYFRIIGHEENPYDLQPID